MTRVCRCLTTFVVLLLATWFGASLAPAAETALDLGSPHTYTFESVGLAAPSDHTVTLRGPPTRDYTDTSGDAVNSGCTVLRRARSHR